VTEPLTLSFEVACSAEHAFAVWTGRIGSWWPRDHTVSGDTELAVVLEGSPGGRIYERTADGREHDWGEVTTWEPPHRLRFLWHLGRDATTATEVEVSFTAHGEATTVVDIVQRGWEALGGDPGAFREQNRQGWQSVVPFYLAAIAGGRPS
jgi:uncharacterized protein YndB with AHSA1/START domain